MKIDNHTARCDACEAIIKERPWRINRAKRHYCDMACRKGARMVTIECDACEKELYRPINQVKRGYLNFCNRKCRGVWQSKFMEGKQWALKADEDKIDPKIARRKREKKNYEKDKTIKLLRSRVYSAIKQAGGKKSHKTMKLVACTVDTLKAHLQQTALQNGYLDFDINNYDGREYHIDHVVGCASFDLTKAEEQKECFNWSNMQILTAKENLHKR